MLGFHKTIFTVLFILIAITSSFAQDSSRVSQLQLMNGKLMNVQLIDSSGANIFFNVQKRSGKWVSRNLYKDQVFSIISPEKIESVLYQKIDIIGNDFTINEMRHYIYGERDAMNGYNAKPTFYGGLIIGAGGAYLLNGGVLFPFLIPLGYTLGMQIPFIKVKEKSISDMKYTTVDTYILGYEKNARTKKAINSILGSLLGAAIGVTVYELTN